MTATLADAPAALPAAEAWSAAAQAHADLFDPLEPGARIALLARSAPTQLLLWEASPDGVAVRTVAFESYAASGADILLAADDASLARVRGSSPAALFEVLRAGIRSGHIVCYQLRRRCLLEERGFEELLEALGFAFMGACR